jgi:hypothetical protein
MPSKEYQNLRKCPFCGSNDIRKVVTLKYAEICCASCHACITRGLICGKAACLADAEESFGEDVTEAWNRRAE